MKIKIFLIALSAVLIFCGISFAAQVKGDVLVTFYNPSSDIPVTKESLSPEGFHAEYIKSVAEELDAKVSFIYDNLSIESNTIMALFHTDTRSETDLWFDLRMRDDVKGASFNYLNKISSTKKGKAR